MSNTPNVSFTDLLEKAVTEPGQLHAAFRAFHNYSFGNQLLAWAQCLERGLALGPIASFMSWKAKGRHVKKGEKAIVLCMPVTSKRERELEDGTTEKVAFTRFVYRPNWFVLSQTDGAELAAEPLPTWNLERALAALDITEKAFDLLDGNIFGYAEGRTIAINPVAPTQHATRAHEIAHILLGHTTADGRIVDGKTLDRHERELEAECVALLVTAALGLDGQEFSRGYIQTWWGQGNPVPEKNAQRILKVVDQILKAGAPPASADAAAEVA